MKKLLTAVYSQFLFVMFSASANSAVTIVFEEVGSDVVATATGSLDTSGLGASFGTTAVGALFYGAPDQWLYEVGTGGGLTFTAPYSPAQTLHTTPIPVASADSSTGGPVGVLDSPLFTAGPRVLVPAGYVSNDPINATATWTGATFSSLQLTAGSYLFDYGTDSLTFEVRSSGVGAPLPPITEVLPVPTVPLAGLFLSILGLVGAAAWHLRRSTVLR